MNSLERAIYDLLKNNPKLKNRIRDLYQLALALVPVKRVASKYPLVVRRGFFYGFHDKIPFSADDKLLLAHRYLGADNKEPGAGDQVEVGCFEGPDYLEFRPLGKTAAWNWTQGAMLQWIGETKQVIFNDCAADKHVARIFDLQGRELAKVPYPVGAVSPGGGKALSYNFARLRRGMPGYGYAGGADPDRDVLIPFRKGSGLKLFDLKSGQGEELFTVADLAAIKPEASMEGAFHYFTHCLFAPSGKRFVFFHRWLVKDNRRYTRMVSADLSGGNLHIFPAFEMVSHVAWQDDRHLLAYARTREQGDKYYLFTDRSSSYRVVGERSFSSDGHPQYAPGGQYFVTDTYPDRFGRQHLMIYDQENDQRIDLASLKQPLRYIKGTRCDFHPRWNRKGDLICFDSAHPGKRSLCTIKLEQG